MTALDTNTVIAVSAAIASVLSAGAAIGALFIQYRLLPRPVWVNASKISFNHPATLVWDLKIVNRGNAAAHDVMFKYENKDGGLEPIEWHHSEVLPFGEAGIEEHMNIMATMKDGTHYPLDRIYVHVYWRQAPRVEKIRHKMFHMETPPRPTHEEGEKWFAAGGKL